MSSLDIWREKFLSLCADIRKTGAAIDSFAAEIDKAVAYFSVRADVDG